MSNFQSAHYDYIAYIDEAGDVGLRQIQTKDHPNAASEWFVLGCTLVRREQEPIIPEYVAAFRNGLNLPPRTFLHYTGLSDSNQRRLCEMIAKKPFKIFVVCSNKKNIEKYRNERAAAKSKEPFWFYQWMARILIERVSHFVFHDSIDKFNEPRKIMLEFASTSSHPFSKIGAYIHLLQTQTNGNTVKLTRNRIFPDVLDFRLVRSNMARNSDGLQISDTVASAFYDAIDNINTGPCNHGNAKLLKPKVASLIDDGGFTVFADYGVVLQPTPFWSVQISEDQKDLFRHYGYNFWKKR